MTNNLREEPKMAPEPDRWYNLTLGPSFNDDSANKYCTLRYEFVPASIDKKQPGMLHKHKDKRVSVEFHNNQVGKPKVVFEGTSEDCREKDAVLFFDGESFRLERLHRAVNRLRHLREPGESAASVAVEPKQSPAAKVPKTVNVGSSKLQAVRPQPAQVDVEQTDVREPDVPGSGSKTFEISDTDHPSIPPNVSTTSSCPKDNGAEDIQEINIEDIFGTESSNGNPAENKTDLGFDMNVPQPSNSDDEIADVDDSGDEADKGPTAAEALRAQVNPEEERDELTSNSSSSSGSDTSEIGSGSGSSTSSTNSEGSDEDSINSI